MVALRNEGLRKEDELTHVLTRCPTRLRRPRLALVASTDLPEATDYPDTGCQLAPSCLNCPLPRCKYDEPFTVRRLANAARDREIALVRRKHHAPVAAIAATYGISRRQVFRILEQQAAE